MADRAPLRFLALGDSYTIGEGVPADGRWTHQLAAALRAEGIAIEDPHTIATTGWTTDELAVAIDAAEPLGTHDLVSLLIGVNNQYRGRSCADYRVEFHTLLGRAIALAGGRADRVLVLSIPDWGVTPFAAQQGRDAAQVAREIDDFNAAACALCEAHGVAFVNITDVSRTDVSPDGGDAAMLVDDGLHPSAAMYARWARRALPVARAMLSAA